MKSLNPERERKILTILAGACDMAPGDLSAYLDAQCGGDASLREEVLALYRLQMDDPQYMESPAQFVPPGELSDEEVHIPAVLSLNPGDRLDDFEIVERISEGGMGEIYKARDLRLHRMVALKLLQKELRGSRDRSSQLEQEGYLLASVTHPNVLGIHQLLRAEGAAFLVLEHVDGQTLRDSIRRLDLPSALDIAIQVAHGLVAVHDKGIVHCDIKPENIMLSNDGNLVKILDFGISIRHRPQGKDDEPYPYPAAHGSGGMLGFTPTYMSPEQLVKFNEDPDVELDPRTDIFSFGVVLYEMVARRPPFRSSTELQIAGPAPLSQYRAEVPDELQRIVSKALRTRREERYQTAADLRIDLQSLKSEVEHSNLSQRFKEQIGESLRSGSQGQTGDPYDLIRYLPPEPVPGTIEPLPSVSLLPVDLGTICGLDRSTFISVVAGFEDDNFFDNLIHAEQCLRKALQRREREGPFLPVRRWIRVDAADYGMIPGSKDELLLTTNYPAETQPQHRPSVIPGIFIELHAAEIEKRQALLVSTQAWCDTLINQTFRGEQMAVVVHVIADRPGEATEAVAKVARRLRQVSGHIPLDVFTADDAEQPPETGVAADEDADGDDEEDPWAPKPNYPHGYHFRSWVNEATKPLKERDREKVQGKYGKVIHLHQALRELCKDTKARPKPSSAREVVKDLDAVAHLDAAADLAGIASDASPQPLVHDGLDEEFLNFVGDYMPARLEELLRAYVGSTRECARRAAVVCAVKKGLPGAAWGDNLMERLTAVADEPPCTVVKESAFDSSWLDAHANVSGSIIDPMALALLRRYVRDREEEIEPLIVELSGQPGLSAGLKAVCDLVLDRTSLKDFMRDNGREVYALALRAGVLSADSWFALSPGEIAEELSLDNPDLWALVAAIPTNLDWLSVLLGMGERRRAILGLITAEEWASLRPDELLLEKVLAARQGRPLYFRS